MSEKVKNLRRLEAMRNELNAKVRMLREELQLLHEPGSYVGEVVKLMGKTKVLVKVGPFWKLRRFFGRISMSVHLLLARRTAGRCCAAAARTDGGSTGAAHVSAAYTQSARARVCVFFWGDGDYALVLAPDTVKQCLATSNGNLMESQKAGRHCTARQNVASAALVP